MNLNALQAFVAIHGEGGFHGAARRLNITQTAVSARIRTLEQAVGSVLFDRGPGGTRLTAAGRQLLPHAEQMLRTWDFVSSDLLGGGRERSSLRLGAQLSVWDALLVDLAVWLEEEREQVPFTLNYDHTLDMAQAVRQRLLDLVIVNEAPPAAAELEVVTLEPEKLVLVSPEPLTSGDDMPLFVDLQFGAEYEAQLHAALPGRSRRHIVLGNALMGLRYLLRRGGIGYFPRAMVAEFLAQGRLHPVRSAPEIELSCYALYLTDNPALPQIRDVLGALERIRPGTAVA